MKQRVMILLTALLAIGLMVGCGGDEPSSTAAVNQPTVANDLTPEELGELGVRLEAEPERIEEILDEHGLTLETYEAAIRQITENPGEAKRYADAYDRASS